MLDHQATLPIQHGGNQSAIRARLRLGNRPLLDFSAPLNGLGPPRGRGRRGPRGDRQHRPLPRAGRAPAGRAAGRIPRRPRRPDPRRGRDDRADQPGRPGPARRPARQAPASWATPSCPSPTWSSRPTASTAGPRPRTASAPRSGTATTLGWDQDFVPRGARGIVWTVPPEQPHRPRLGPRPPARA